MYLAVAALALHRLRPDGRWAAAAGAALGLGYLMRYTTLPFLLVAVLFLCAPTGDAPIRRRAHLAAFCAAFLLASAPQWIPTALVHGHPFWNRQDANVYFFALGHGDWGEEWTQAQERAHGVVAVVVDHPGAVAANLRRNLGALPHLFGGLSLPGLALAGALFLAARRDDRTARAIARLLVGCLLTFALALSLTTVHARVAMPILPALAALAGCALGGAVHAVPGRRGLRYAALAGVVLLLSARAERDFRRLHVALRPSHLTAVSEALRAHGMIDGGEVMSLGDAYVDLGSPLKRLFPRPWLSPRSFQPRSMSDLIECMRRLKMRYLVLDDAARERFASPGSFSLPAEAPPELREIYRGSAPPHARIWRLPGEP
jgi:hypothetical protein